LTDVTDIFQDSDEDKDWWETDVPEIETGLRDLSVQRVAPDQPPAYEAVRGLPAPTQDQENGDRGRRPRLPPRPTGEPVGLAPVLPRPRETGCSRALRGRCDCSPACVELEGEDSDDDDEIDIVFVGENHGMFPETARQRGRDWIQDGRASRLKLMQYKTRYLEDMVERLVGGQEYDYDKILRLGDRVLQLETTAHSLASRGRGLRGRGWPPSRVGQRHWGILDTRDTCGRCRRRGHTRAYCYGLPVFPARRPQVPCHFEGRYYLHEGRNQRRPRRGGRC